MAPKCLSGFYIITPLGCFPDIFIPIILTTKKEFGGELTRDINLLYFACLPNILVLYRISLILLRSEEVMRNIDNMSPPDLVKKSHSMEE